LIEAKEYICDQSNFDGLFPEAMTEPHGMAVSCSRKLRRPCIPCRISKKGCNREVSVCQSCCDRGQPIYVCMKYGSLWRWGTRQCRQLSQKT
jgi:hypothetical protein